MIAKTQGAKENRKVRKHMRRGTERAVSVAAALFCWEICALLIQQKILLAGPLDMLQALLRLVVQTQFWQTIAFSSVRIAAGFGAGVLLGCLCAAIAGNCRSVEILFQPYLAVMKATPVASVIILCLVWFSSRNLSILISFFMVFPVVYTNVLTGIHNLDEGMEEMADVYGICGWRRFLYVRLPQLGSYLMAALQLGCGMAWKSGVAAEVIGIPAGSVGRQIYDAKIYLATPELFAWTFTLIVVSVLFEKAVVQMMRALLRGIERRLS